MIISLLVLHLEYDFIIPKHNYQSENSQLLNSYWLLCWRVLWLDTPTSKPTLLSTIAPILIFFFISILISNAFLGQKKVSNCANKLRLVNDKVNLPVLKAGLIATY